MAWFLTLVLSIGFSRPNVSDAAGTQASPDPPKPNDGGGISVAEARQRTNALHAEIARHDVLYYEQATPDISDFAYDQLKRELAELEGRFPGPDSVVSPISAVGDDRTGLFPTHRHRERMLGLDKTYLEAELRTFLARLARQLNRGDLVYVIEPKFDGIAISVTYEQGKFARAVTRGNGIEGDDITVNASLVRSLPRELQRKAPDGSANPIPNLIELRGEVYMTFAEFARINREREVADEPVFAHPRNLAAGTAKRRDPRETKERRLDIVFYGWGACEPIEMVPGTQHGFHEQARAWGLPIVEKYWIVRDADKIFGAVHELDGLRHQLAFPVDGAVVKLDSVALRRILGETDRAPRWAMAFKYAPDRAETRLLSITIQVGRTGLLTPVAELAPVRLAGGIVSRVTLHNREVIARQDIRVGDSVYVEKAGEIIPAITGVDRAQRDAESAPYVFPDVCPACGTPVVQLAGETAVRCPNSTCPAQIVRRLRHFASQSCVHIDGLGEATIKVLVEKHGVKNVADLYRLRRDDLETLGLNVAKSTDRLLAAIERSKRAELSRFIYGLGIPGVGAATARDLARRFSSLEALAAARREDFAAARGGLTTAVGEATISAVLSYFRMPQNRSVIAELSFLGVQPAAPALAARSHEG